MNPRDDTAMTPESVAALRELLGDAAIGRLTGLDRRTIQRAAAGEATIYPDTAEKLQHGLINAARLAGADAIDVVERVAAALPATGPTAMRVALLLWQYGEPVLISALQSRLQIGKNRSPLDTAIERLAAAGLVRITRPDEGYGITAEWIA